MESGSVVVSYKNLVNNLVTLVKFKNRDIIISMNSEVRILSGFFSEKGRKFWHLVQVTVCVGFDLDEIPLYLV
jgi:hypothetical protein